MLASLHIENVAVIKKLDIDFDTGFTVFTGETGAGKSIIIDSIRLLLGSKADKGIIRNGEECAVVSALFSSIDGETVKKLGEIDVFPDENGEISVYRAMSRDGRSKAKVNGQTVPVATLSKMGSYLMAIHGQHDAMTLIDESRHIEYLDSYGDISALVCEYNEIYRRMNGVKIKLKEETEQAKTNEYRIKSLQNAIKEISSLKLKRGDVAKLYSQRMKLRDAEKLVKNTGVIYKTLYKSDKAPGCNTLIDLAIASFEKLSDYEEYKEGCDSFIERLRGISLELEEIANEARAMSAGCNVDDPAAALDEIEARLEGIERAMRKYGDGEEALLTYLENAEKELVSIQNSGKRCEEYKKELMKLSKQAFALADEIHEKRHSAALRLEERLGAELRFLDLEKARFKIDIQQSKLNGGGLRLLSDGYDEVRFLISANAGEEPKSIAKIASGGELSRIMMSLRTVFAGKDHVQAMIFDEIDTGVSGKTSEKIGIKLREISSGGQQVFSVTHSAQVAAVAENHLKIRKHEVDGRTETYVERLNFEQRVDELSRIMGGITVSENIRKSAEEMLRKG